MTTAKLSSTFLVLLLLCLKYGHSGVKKIKIHVPYYVKHVHHYKKVYVPKIHVIKHEHHHKKEYDHHHHHHDHHEVYKHRPYRSFEKSSHEFPDESHHDIFYDDVESKSYRSSSPRKRVKPIFYRVSGKDQYQGWKDVDGSDYRGDDSEEEEEYPVFRRNVYFKRRLDVGDNKEEDKEGEGEEEEDEETNNATEEEVEDSQEEDEQEREDEDTTTNVTNNRENLISITTTESGLR